MTYKFLPVVLSGLIGGTMLTSPGHAQDAEQLAAQGDACGALVALSNESADRLRPEWLEQSRTAIQQNDPERCQVFYQQANDALNQTGDAAAAARIIVTQPDANVRVQQEAPQVSVVQAQPSVAVNQGQPEITVRQAPPNVRVQIPQPVVSIDLPQPEIIIRMPDPDVAVMTPEPQVEVRQPEPTVRVEQGAPQVQVQAEQDAQGPANVQVQQEQVQIEQRQAAGEPRIEIQRQEPTVRYEQAEPNVQVENMGEPRVEFSQSGEPNIRVEGGALDRQEAAQGVGQQQDVEVAALVRLRDTGQPMQQLQPQTYNVRDLVGRRVVDREQQPVGTIDRLVNAEDRIYVVLTEVAELGMGNEEVALPLDTMQVSGAVLLVRGLSDEDIETVQGFDTAGAEAVTDDQQVSIGTP